jgi:quinol monooxygenase YgiN
MYGTIAKVTVNPARIAELTALAESMGVGAGQVARYVFQMDANPGEVWLVGVFENREAYWANANSPEQHQRFVEMRALMEADPEWHDGAIISAVS